MSRPALSTLQLAWLEEIGLDRRMLAHFATADSPFSEAAAPSTDASLVSPPSSPQAGGQASAAQPPGRQGDSSQASAAPAAALPAVEAVDGGPPAAPGRGLQPAPTAQVMAALRASASSGAGRFRGAPPAAPSEAPAPRISQRGEHPIPQDWDALQQHMAGCAECELQTARSHVVAGSGQMHAPAWMVIGEAPGNRDDREALPFQGKAGALLRVMLASIGIDGDAQVYYTNIVKCRPLGNRPPTPLEIASCKPYLDRQIALVRPARILALGTLAAQALLGRPDELDALRGSVHDIRDESGREIPLVATYHPASLLLRPQHKADAWRDLNLARSLMARAPAAQM